MIPILPIAAVMALSMVRARRSTPEAPRISMGASLLWVFGSIWLMMHANRAAECSAGLSGSTVGVFADDCWFMTAPATFAIDAVTLIVLFPWGIATLIAIPLGLVRVSWVLGWLASVRFAVDRRGGATLAAAWALLRQRQRRPQAGAAGAIFVDAQLARCQPMRGAALVAAALARAAAGQRQAARSLLESVELLDATTCPRRARMLAREWLVADAVADGRWARAAELGQPLAPQPSTWTTLFLASVAARLSPAAHYLARGPSDRLLILRWLLSRRRTHSLVLLRRALDARPRPGGVQAVEDASRSVALRPAADLSALDHALSLHISLLRSPGSTPASAGGLVLALGAAWDRALADASVRRRLAERSLALGGCDPDLALERAARAAEDDLAFWALERGRALPERAGSWVARAAGKARERLLGDVELRAELLRQRIEERRSLAALDEWREWLALRDALDRIEQICGWQAQRLAFLQLHDTVSSLAVWLWNDRRERALANAIFRWLHLQALTAGDQPAIELEGRNVQAGAV